MIARIALAPTRALGSFVFGHLAIISSELGRRFYNIANVIPQAEHPDSLIDLIGKVIGWLATGTVYVNGGTAIINNRVIQAGTAPKNIGWGTGTTTPVVADTALQTENAPTTSGGRTVGTESRTTITNANDNYQVTGTVTATLAGPTAQTEYGDFDAVTAGNMLIHAVYASISVVTGDSIAFTRGLKQVAGAVLLALMFGNAVLI